VGRLGGQCRVGLRHKGECYVGQRVLHVARGRGGRGRVFAVSPSARLLGIRGIGLGCGVIQTVSGWLQPALQEVYAPWQMEGAGLGREAGTLLHQVGAGLRPERLRGQRLCQGAGDGRRGVHGAQGHHLAHVVLGMQAPLLQLEVIRCRARREGETPQEEPVIAAFLPLLQEWLGVLRGFHSLAPGGPAGLAGHERVPVVEAEPIRGGFERKGLAGIRGWHRRALGIAGHAKRPGGSDLRHRRASAWLQGQGAQPRALGLPEREGGVLGCALHADLGDRIEPLSGSGIPGTAVGELQICQAVLFDVAPPIFPLAFCMALAHMTGGNGKAVGGGEVQRHRIAHGGCAAGALAHGSFAVGDHDCVGHAAEALTGVLMTGQAGLHGLGDGALHLPHPTVAQDHHQDAQPSRCWPYRDGAERAPSNLGSRARRQGQGEKGGVSPGSDGADLGCAPGIAPVKALRTQALKHLGCRIGRALQQADNLRFAGSEFPGVRPWLARPAVFLGQPIGPRARIERQCLGNL
jgi:hypothetical protein